MSKFTNALVEAMVAEYGEDDQTWRGMGSARRITRMLESKIREQVAEEIRDAGLALVSTDADVGHALTAAILDRAATIALCGAA